MNEVGARETEVGSHPRTGALTLHHVGFVVAAIADAAPEFAKWMGITWSGEVIHDPLQFANVAFLGGHGSQKAALELVQPDGPESPLHKFLARGGGLHHVCYEVDSVEEQLKNSRAGGCIVVKSPLPAAAFGGRKIAWVYTPQKLLVEYLERSGRL
jgi:methylmalonyl-CoA/ethylmalonyl-CoA epimerase